MTFEYSPADDAVIEWHDDTPPVRLCPKCGQYRTIGNFWRRPSPAEYTFSMKRNPAALPVPYRIPPVESTRCYICNGENTLRSKTRAQLEVAHEADLLTAGQLAAELMRRKHKRVQRGKRVMDARWGAVRAAPWQHAWRAVAKHLNVIRAQGRYYGKHTSQHPASIFFSQYAAVIADVVVPRLRASAADGSVAEPLLTWREYLGGDTWDTLHGLWATFLDSRPRRVVKQPFILSRSEPMCLVFAGFEFPEDQRRVKVSKNQQHTQHNSSQQTGTSVPLSDEAVASHKEQQ